MSTQAEPGGFGPCLASGAAPPRFFLIFLPGPMIAAIARHRAE